MAGSPVYLKRPSNPGRQGDGYAPGYGASILGDPKGSFPYNTDLYTTNKAEAMDPNQVGYIGTKGKNIYGTRSAALKGTVICSELYRRGDMPQAIWEADSTFGRKQSPQLMAGYHFWAKPLVRLMQRSELTYRIVRIPAIHWANYMAYQEGVTPKTDYLGALIHNLGAPLCYGLGMFVLALRAKTIRS